jgi:hypothetical protein
MRGQLTPGVEAIATKVFAARRALDPRTDTTALRIHMGPAAYYALCREGSDVPMIVGRHIHSFNAPPQDISTMGVVDAWYVLGVPVVYDPEGPHRQWRMVGEDGLTVTWGEWPDTPTPQPPPT